MPYTFQDNDLYEVYLALIGSGPPDPDGLAKETTLLSVADNTLKISDELSNGSGTPSVFKDPASDTTWFSYLEKLDTLDISNSEINDRMQNASGVPSVFKDPATDGSWMAFIANRLRETASGSQISAADLLYSIMGLTASDLQRSSTAYQSTHTPAAGFATLALAQADYMTWAAGVSVRTFSIQYIYDGALWWYVVTFI